MEKELFTGSRIYEEPMVEVVTIKSEDTLITSVPEWDLGEWD